MLLTLLAASGGGSPAAASPHDDAGSGGDAGDTWTTALEIEPSGAYAGRFARETGDLHDHYRFFVRQGESLSIDVHVGLLTGSIQVSDSGRRLGVQLLDPHGLVVDTPHSNVGDARVTLAYAPLSGYYTLRLDGTRLPSVVDYGFCFATVGGPCVSYGLHGIDLLYALPNPKVNVLLVPPTHGNPTGSETALDYLEATLRGIRAWKPALASFAQDFPKYAYVTQLEMNVEVFDETAKYAGYDVVVVWAEYTGPVFRGLAVNPWGSGIVHHDTCLSLRRCDVYERFQPYLRDGGRVIVMSLFAAAPRAGQVLPDWPEVNDVQNVAQHEIAHTWGLGHTQTWLQTTGADLMNSPYAEVFGDGDPLGDGGERTPLACISSLDLYGLASLYAWLGAGAPYTPRAGATATLPAHVPYRLYC